MRFNPFERELYQPERRRYSHVHERLRGEGFGIGSVAVRQTSSGICRLQGQIS